MTENEAPRLSPSIAHVLTTESPLAAWAKHRLLGGFVKPPTSSQIDGRIWHAAILESGKDVVPLPFDAFRSKEAKAAKAEVEAEGKLAIAEPKWNAMIHSVKRLREELDARGLRIGPDDPGETEKRYEWTEYTEAGEPVECSAVLDHVNEFAITDLKTGDSCVSEREASLLVARGHALLQDAAYRSAVSVVDGIELVRTDLTYVFVQTVEPHCVTPVMMSGEFQQLSELRWRRAIEIWHECLSRGVNRRFWPGPVPEGIGTIYPPAWMMSQELELEAIGND